MLVLKNTPHNHLDVSAGLSACLWF